MRQSDTCMTWVACFAGASGHALPHRTRSPSVGLGPPPGCARRTREDAGGGETTRSTSISRAGVAATRARAVAISAATWSASLPEVTRGGHSGVEDGAVVRPRRVPRRCGTPPGGRPRSVDTHLPRRRAARRRLRDPRWRCTAAGRRRDARTGSREASRRSHRSSTRPPRRRLDPRRTERSLAARRTRADVRRGRVRRHGERSSYDLEWSTPVDAKWWNRLLTRKSSLTPKTTARHNMEDAYYARPRDGVFAEAIDSAAVRARAIYVRRSRASNRPHPRPDGALRVPSSPVPRPSMATRPGRGDARHRACVTTAASPKVTPSRRRRHHAGSPRASRRRRCSCTCRTTRSERTRSCDVVALKVLALRDYASPSGPRVERMRDGIPLPSRYPSTSTTSEIDTAATSSFDWCNASPGGAGLGARARGGRRPTAVAVRDQPGRRRRCSPTSVLGAGAVALRDVKPGNSSPICHRKSESGAYAATRGRGDACSAATRARTDTPGSTMIGTISHAQLLNRSC